MHGIPGGDDPELIDEIRSSIRGELSHAVYEGGQHNELVKVCRQIMRGILWSRIKQRPMVVVNIIDL